ncbi:transcriptional regulator [uncultured phage cr60_1]|uniref:Transcriptional regulator n=1 Tax=uncultured phage cr60_1 TaxID=2772082 RepID=A0A7M1RRC6_9CAUD|nr:transcriptional regulator [uncultured phage cr60_1]QOR56923.1 transcriptional regulator [uncultured phage cr60_1]
MNKLVKAVPKTDLLKEFLKSLNGILNLTDRELELLTTFVELDVNTPKLPNIHKNVISTENRKYIKRTLGITPDNLSRYIAKFKALGILQRGKAEDEVFVNKALIPEIIGDRVQITIILKLKKDEDEITNA